MHTGHVGRTARRRVRRPGHGPHMSPTGENHGFDRPRPPCRRRPLHRPCRAARSTLGERTSASSVAVLLIAVSLVPVGWLHLVTAAALDPISHPVSYYVLAPHGPALLAVTAVTLAAGTTMQERN